ncbi:hypothetical protein Y1Q_0004146 [Alligator mississippiensis]|uniref:Uncharacterized protein n=1 Tax=Alligator mississippiensis TaxID=8496 RepID=A0A151PI55_ALLMI|nr:hypothetical protein Y1Q_0004146 [Alligator mississippiensis]
MKGPTSGCGRQPTSQSKDVESGSPPPTAGATQMCWHHQQCTQDWTILLQWLVAVAEEQEVQDQAWDQVQDERELAWQDKPSKGDGCAKIQNQIESKEENTISMRDYATPSYSSC